jgi:hypothetical protein
MHTDGVASAWRLSHLPLRSDAVDHIRPIGA